MIALFLEKKWKWIGSDGCWWCNRGRQPREHLQIHTLWGKVGGVSGDVGGSTLKSRKGFGSDIRNPNPRTNNKSIRGLLGSEISTDAVLAFRKDTKVVWSRKES